MDWNGFRAQTESNADVLSSLPDDLRDLINKKRANLNSAALSSTTEASPAARLMHQVGSEVLTMQCIKVEV